MESSITLALFTPAEAERITGVSTSLQRDWRRRGFLTAHGGHARFDIFGLAGLKFLHMMSARGIGPEHSILNMQFASLGIAAWALLDEQAYSGDHHRTLSWNSVFAPGGELEGNWDRKGEYLAKYLLRKEFGPIIPGPYFILWPDGTEYYCPVLQMAFDPRNEKLPLSRLSGPSIVLDFTFVGADLLAASDRPFAHVEYEMDGDRAIPLPPAKAPGEK